MSINVQPLTGHIGAEISGVDLNQIDDAQVRAIRTVWLQHKVIFIRHQSLTPDELVAAAQRFGNVERLHDGLNRLPGSDRVLLVETKEGQGDGPDGAFWHSDVTFAESPPMASMMYAVKLPQVGGDTLFSSMTAAWEALSDPLKRVVRDLEAYHDGIPYFSSYLMQPSQTDGAQRLAALRTKEPGALHPVVRCHDETGENALFVNRPFTQRILGLSEVESRNLLNLLIEHAEQESFQVRWQWSQGDVAFWDNRQAMHYPAYDYGNGHRLMHRVTLLGEKPRREAFTR